MGVPLRVALSVISFFAIYESKKRMPLLSLTQKISIENCIFVSLKKYPLVAASSLFKTLLIIPFYNEEARIDRHKLAQNFKQFYQLDFLLIDDGSQDQTPQILQSFAQEHKNVSVRKNDKNLGKAESLRQGVLSAEIKKYDYIGYLDADLATPISEIVRLLNYAEKNTDKKLIMGTRIKLLGNRVKRSLVRHYFGRIFATIISQFVLKIPVYDTQCGAKIIQASLAQEIFKTPFYTKWLFDVELLLRMRKQSIDLTQNVVEIPLFEWTEMGDSKIRWYEFLSVPFQIIKLYAKYS